MTNIDRIHPVAFEEALLNIGMSINEIRALTDPPAPQIIRTLDELEALNPETLCVTSPFGNVFPAMVLHKRPKHALPAAVIATGPQVRAARTALQEATE